MSLVTVTRSPSETGSPHSTLLDKNEDSDGNERYEKSECFFTGKGTALILALREIPHHIIERRKSTESDKCAGNISSANLDIQHHLQSMFYLLCHEDTLKMAVKLESQRPNRTRYLAIVSRPCFKNNNGMNISSGSRLLLTKKSKKSTYQQKDNEIQQNNNKLEIPLLTSSSSSTMSSSPSTAVSLSLLTSSTSSSTSSSSPPSIITTATTIQRDISNIKEFEDIRQNDNEESSLNNNNESNISHQYNKCSTTKRNINCDIPVKESSSRTDSVELEESCLLGIDCNEKTTIGLVLKVLADTTIRLDGDGGFSVNVYGKTHIFKPVSVQAMWSALQTLHKVSHKARDNNFYPGGPSHEWVSYYESQIKSDRSCLNEWNAMDSIESRRPPSPDAIENKPTEREETKQVIRMKLKEIMMSVDLDEVTSKYIRGRLEQLLDMDLGEYKSFIDEEMLTILGQMDAPTEIFEHVYLGSEWNASNLEELQRNGVRHILNVTREIDNFFPGMFDYFNVRVYDDEKTNLLKYWDNTFRYITRAKNEGSKVLVHCKMGVSRSASVVIAYAMKAYNWDFSHALQHVKERRNCVKPNKSFLAQLETYRGMLDAMQNKEKLQRSKSETNLKSTKDARLIPGSEPTPLIQALNSSNSLQKGSATVESPMSSESSSLSSNYRSTIKRSNSSLSKNFESTSPESMMSKQQSISLEDLVTMHNTIHNTCQNVRYPGTNGQNYSITQNQILHIQENNSVNSSIDDLVRHSEKDKIIKISNILQQENDNSEVTLRNKNEACHDEDRLSSNENLIWTSSSQLIRQSTNLDIAASKSSLDSCQSDAIEVQRQQQQQQQHQQHQLQPQHEQQPQSQPQQKENASDYFSFHLDNIFENEETRNIDHHRYSAPLTNQTYVTLPDTSYVSRQSSCSSVDSAVILGGYSGDITEIPSRQSSWGSGDNRILPSRNSSWGSYDTNRSTSSTYKILKQFRKYPVDSGDSTGTILISRNEIEGNVCVDDKDDNILPLTVGTVKRTKQKLEENSNNKKKLCGGGEFETNKLDSNICQGSASVSNTATSINATTTTTTGIDFTSTSSKSILDNLKNVKTKSASRSHSEETIYNKKDEIERRDIRNIVRGQSVSEEQEDGGNNCWDAQKLENLSASAPETFSIDKYAKVLQDQQLKKKKQNKGIENASHVQNLKKNFEAKASVVHNSFSKKGQSLPSSPIASHSGQKDLNVKDLVTKYQASEPLQYPHQQQNRQHHHQKHNTAISNKMRPRSFYESRSSQMHDLGGGGGGGNRCSLSITSSSSTVQGGIITNVPTFTTAKFVRSKKHAVSTAIAAVTAAANAEQKQKLNNNNNNNNSNNDKNRPPPIPPIAKIPINNHFSMTDGILSENFHQRKVQHYGKTHPLARLSFCKKKLNTAANYNTM